MKRLFLIVVLMLSFAAVSKNSFADDASLDTLNEKLNTILANQDTILSQLQEIRSELQVVKIRTTQ